MALWVADGAIGLRKAQGQPLTPPCHALCKWRQWLYAAGEEQCFCICPKECSKLFDFPLPRGVCTLAGFGPFLCALSRETDSLFAFAPESGDLCLSVPAGSYPRDFSISPCGKYLAVAGSAAGEVMLFNQALHCIRRERIAGAAVGACFVPGGLAVLCAVGEEMLSARLLFITHRGVTEEICAFPQPPLYLCALPDGSCLAGCQGNVYRINMHKKPAGVFSSPLPVRIRQAGQGILIADAFQGVILDGHRQIHYRGKDPQDMCYIG